MPNTLNDFILESFLTSTEQDICDFKKEIYDMSDDDTKVKFLKDIISMSNTIRNTSAFIIVGINENKQTGKKEFFDVDMSIDENTFITFLASHIAPEMPPFSYYHYPYKKVTLGIFEIGIPTNGSICMSKRDHLNKLEKDKVYYRNSSVNSEASEEKIKDISMWLQNFSSNKWELFLKYSEYFQTNIYNYILVYDNIDLTSNQSALLASISWSAIVDLSAYSENSGLYKNQHNELQKYRHIHLITPTTKMVPSISEDKSLVWIMAGGEDDALKLPYRDWSKKYSKYLINHMKNIINNFSKYYIIISLTKNNEITKFLYYTLPTIDDKLMHRHIALSNDDIENDDTVEINLTLSDIYLALSNFSKSKRVSNEVFMPSKHGDFLPIADISYLKEELTLVHKHIAEDENVEYQNKHSYYRGEALLWRDFESSKIIHRKEERQLRKRIESAYKELKKYGDQIVVPYIAGAGGTSILKSLAWSFHHDYPVVILEKYSNSTTDKLRILYKNLENSPIIVLIDNLAKDTHSLLRECNIAGIKILSVIFERYISTPTRTTFHIPETLGDDNFHFYNKFHNEILEELELPMSEKQLRKKSLDSIYNGSPDIQTPFMYSLSTFENDFAKLSEYVDRKLDIKSMTHLQKDIFCFLAIAHRYGALDVPATILNMISESRNYISILTEGQKSLITKNTSHIRLSHQSIANEVLINLCLNNNIQRLAWKNRLKDILVQFIDILANLNISENIIVAQLLYNVFIDRNSASDFSYSISDLPNNDNKIYVFNHLIKNFPYNAHIQGHFARFLLAIEDFTNAIRVINNAIEIEQSYTFYHTKGLILTKILLDKMKNLAKENDQYSITDLDNFDIDIKEIIACYDHSIKLSPDNKYAYQSKVHLFLELIRSVYQYLNTDLSKLQNGHASWCLAQIDTAETYFSEATVAAEQYDHDINKESLEGQIYSLKGDFNKALTTWDSLLSKPTTFCPPIRRQIVHTYNKRWQQLTPKQIERCLTLLEDNITEESGNVSNILLWLECARKTLNRRDLLDKAIDFLQFSTDKPSINKDFYCFILLITRSLQRNIPIDLKKYNNLRNSSLAATRTMITRGQIKEFYDSNRTGLDALVNYHSLKNNNPDSSFDQLIKNLGRIKGRIIQIQREESGYIEVANLNIRVHFNPNYKQGYSYNKGDENKLVSFVLGFSYDDIYAFDVRFVN